MDSDAHAWVAAGIVLVVLLADVPRHRVSVPAERAARQARSVAAELRARARERGKPAAPALRRAASAQRGEAAAATRLAVRGRIPLLLAWVGAEFAIWHWQLGAGWTPGTDGEVLTVCACAAAFLLRWWALHRAAEPAAGARALSATVLTTSAVLVVGVFAADVDVAEGTSILALLVGQSPAGSAALGAALARPPRPALTPAARALAERLDPATAPPPEPVAEARPEAPAPPPIEIVPMAALTLGERLERRHPHLLYATVPGRTEPLVCKRFGGTPDQERRNPTRPLDAYRELLSRRAPGAEEVLLWPEAVLADGDRAVGVLYPKLAGDFLLRSGLAQTGDHLWAPEPEHSGCRPVTVRQRAEVLLDVVRAHELLHGAGLAHGDTGWKNFVYGVDGGVGRGIVIDVDGVTAVDDPQPLLLFQHGWEVDQALRPIDRDRVRLGLLTARLATPTIEWDRTAVPDRGVEWFTPAVRRAARTAIERHHHQAVPQLRAALEEALA